MTTTTVLPTSKVRHLNPYQVHAFYRRWEQSVLWDYHPREHGHDLASSVAWRATGRANPDSAEVFEAMIALEAAGVDCPVRGSSWEHQRYRWGKWLQVVSGPIELGRRRIEPDTWAHGQG